MCSGVALGSFPLSGSERSVSGVWLAYEDMGQSGWAVWPFSTEVEALRKALTLDGGQVLFVLFGDEISETIDGDAAADV